MIPAAPSGFFTPWEHLAAILPPPGSSFPAPWAILLLPCPPRPLQHSRAFSPWLRNAGQECSPRRREGARLALPTMPACVQGRECCPTWSWIPFRHLPTPPTMAAAQPGLGASRNQRQTPLGTSPAAFHGNSCSFGGLWAAQRGLSSTQELSWSLTPSQGDTKAVAEPWRAPDWFCWR